MSLVRETLTRIVYLQNILSYITNKPKKFLSLIHINTSWHECVMEYSEEVWMRINMHYKYEGNKLLHILVKNQGPIRMMSIFLCYGMDKEARNEYNMTPLQNACCTGYTECVKLLLENGADKDTKNVNNCTPLHNACYHGYPECVKLLLENGADKETKNRYGKTPLHFACMYNNSECVKLLLEAGADKELRDDNDRTAQYLARKKGHEECVKLFE